MMGEEKAIDLNEGIKEMRREEKSDKVFLDTPKLIFGVQLLKKGEDNTTNGEYCHDIYERIYYVVRGNGKLQIGNKKSLTVIKGHAYYVPHNVTHKFCDIEDEIVAYYFFGVEGNEFDEYKGKEFDVKEGEELDFNIKKHIDEMKNPTKKTKEYTAKRTSRLTFGVQLLKEHEDYTKHGILPEHPFSEIYYIEEARDGNLQIGEEPSPTIFPVKENWAYYIPSKVPHKFYDNENEIVFYYIFGGEDQVCYPKTFEEALETGEKAVSEGVIKGVSAAVSAVKRVVGKKHDIKISPTSGKVGTKVTVTGTGFATNSNVTVTFDAVPQTRNLATNATGGFIVAFSVPQSIAGSHTVTATDASANSESKKFTVIS